MLFYLDCDTGIDDAVALALLLAHDDVELGGIGTVNGNTSAAQAATDLRAAGLGRARRHPGRCRWRPLAGRDTAGARRQRRRRSGPARGPGARPAYTVELLIGLAADHPGELHVLAVGPSGNLAAALRTEPRLPELVASVTVMGGAVRVPGNVTTLAEANIADDPRAAAAVLAAPWPLTLVPLDVSMNHRWTAADRVALAASPAAINRALAAMLPAYFDFYEPRLGERAVPLHDPLAAALAVGDVLASEMPELGVGVDLAHGRTVEDPAARPMRVVLAVGEPAGPVILERLLRIRS